MLHSEERYNPITIIVAVLIVLFSALPFVINYKYNDNHLNWLNHDYGKNLMMSAEEGSVFMTEGGDNQVFSTLYFTYSEKLRPDLSLYDQKGNIFKRIYGDMRYIDGSILDRRMEVVDADLFNGQEPFYKEIRTPKDPYFVPYWMGERPLYLTWQRPTPHLLGDYYYKRYGIMYKKQDIEYQLVDLLELKKEMTVDEATRKFQEWLPELTQEQKNFMLSILLPSKMYKDINSLSMNDPRLNIEMIKNAKKFTDELLNVYNRKVDANYASQKIDKLEKEGYIKRNGNQLVFVKMYGSPMKGDYFDSFLLRWHDAPNAMFWDFLTREIIVNYDWEMGEIYRNEVSELQVILAQEMNDKVGPNVIDDIKKRIDDTWTKALDSYEDAIKYGGDSISILHNVATVYMNSGKPELFDRAHTLLSNAVELYPAFFGTYRLLMSYLFMDMLNNPDKEEKNIAELEYLFKKIRLNMSYYRGLEKDPTKHPEWGRQQFGMLENYMMGIKQSPMKVVETWESELNTQIANPAGQIDKNLAKELVMVYYNRGLFLQYIGTYVDKANFIFKKMMERESGDYDLNVWAMDLLFKLVGIGSIPDRSAMIGNAVQIYNNLDKLGIRDEHIGVIYSMGILNIQIGKYADAKNFLNKYVARAKANPKLARANQKMITEAGKTLDQLTKMGVK